MALGLVTQHLARLGTLSATSDHASVVSINIFVALLCGCIVIGHLLEESRWINESITALVIGVCTGAVILLTTKGKSSHIFVFSEDLFFIYLLPPIIFNAGFQVKKKQFFRNFMTIMLFGAIGTLISFFTISLGAVALFRKMDIGSLDIGDFLAIGAIFSATDSVCTLQILNQDETPLLYSLVFGEGVVNDATSVVLFNAIQNFDLVHIDAIIILKFLANFGYLFLTSTLLGAFGGLLSAYIIKKLYIGRHSTDREVALMMLMAYLTYMLAELLDLSGILTVFFCGIVMSHYTWHNVTEGSRITTNPGKSVQISLILLGLVLVGRAAFVFPLSFLSNLTKKSPDDRIVLKQQVTIWWAGLMRGAVSIALAYNQFARSGHTQLRGNAIMITSTISVVLFSTVVFGLMTKPLLSFLLPHNAKHFSSMSSDPSTPKSLLLPLMENGQASEDEIGEHVARPSNLRLLLTKPTHTVHHHWRKFDNAFMRPVFGGRGFVPFVPGSSSAQSLHGWS
ncbi:sodium/hydrogen exchanger 2-like isoform X2 [Zingiber officinale]|uniref:sodium/hydrogen exchanger 2-like isoform X2 n=1 Tax=Zingiber officinale TaxID=94328 RepID=UPI001C4DB1E8|nr:sodium/hydrogen exchanger 2-like isoform X2 [Zingiber officinale]